MPSAEARLAPVISTARMPTSSCRSWDRSLTRCRAVPPFWRTDPTEAARPENHSVAAYAEVENPAVAFVWELRHNPEGALATLPDRSYSKVLDATDVLKELWEDKPAVNELELAKALITQIVLLDDNLCEQVLTRANIMARECSTAVAPYLRPQS